MGRLTFFVYETHVAAKNVEQSALGDEIATIQQSMQGKTPFPHKLSPASRGPITYLEK